MALMSMKAELQQLAVPITDPELKTFVPEGDLAKLFHTEALEVALSVPAFKIPHHKVASTARLVLHEAQKILAICLELNLEHDLVKFIESDITDSALPLDISKLSSLVPEAAARFEELQWKYLAYRFRKGQYHKTLPRDRVLPYLGQNSIGGGGYSKVYKVSVHSAHQDMIETPNAEAAQLVRKQLEPRRQGERAEAELLFLLGSLRHPNIVELLASYTQDGISSLIFKPADFDLHEFLIHPERPEGFENNFTYFHAIFGLSEGLHYLHNFGPRRAKAAESFLHGYHHDIKPRNVLVRGTSFILADFGFAKIKGADEDSQTLWKNTTFEYGAPECRDSESFAPGPVGRALDIWSLACVISEVLTHAENGAQGVEDFRMHRVIEQRYGQTRCFHDGETLSLNVAQHLDGMETQTHSSSVKKLIAFLRIMFSDKPRARATSEEAQQTLAQATIDALVDAVLEAIQRNIDAYATIISQDLLDINLYIIQLRLQKNRISAWVQALGVKSPLGRPSDHQLYNLFNEFYQDLLSAFRELQEGNHFETAEDNHDFILSKLDQTNNSLCKRLSKDVRRSIDDTFRIITTSIWELPSLQRIAALNVDSEELHDVKTQAAMKYMTLLVEKHGNEPNPHCRIESSLVKRTKVQSDPEARPDSWLYSYGYRHGEERLVMVEPMPYWQRQHDMDSSEFQHAIQAMFRRVQELVTVLKYNAKPVDFRTLDCLGAFHDPRRQEFGVVYAFPWEDATPIRLNKLLRHRKKYEVYPDLNDKLSLAKILIACVQSLHTSGWVHKNISSLNIIFFLKSARDLSTLNMREPYMIGFDHSRKDGEGEYSQGQRFRGSKEYLHPHYRQEITGYKRSYDYYALGLVLLEIGTWTSLSNLYEGHPTAHPDELRAKYIQHCTEQLGKTMGPTYLNVTKKCLEYNGGEDGVEEQLQFQTEVVDKLNRCML